LTGVDADPSGVLHERRHALSGESWSIGQVVLSWDDVKAGAELPYDGRNVVLHEFAHQLDQQKGYANGAPPLPSRQREAWSQAFNNAYGHLLRRLHDGQPVTLDAYAATSPAEFFAVATEVFFERPQVLLDAYPEVYRQLASFYRSDPVSWVH
jgi:Mlc titration factor MtfA (ptsG expression regulator)